MNTPTQQEAMRALSVMDEYASQNYDVLNNEDNEAEELAEAYKVLAQYLEAEKPVPDTICHCTVIDLPVPHAMSDH